MPTRITSSTSTILDLTFCNFVDHAIIPCVLIVSVADHLMNSIIVKCAGKGNSHQYIWTRNFKKLNTDNLLSDLANVPWHIVDAIESTTEALKLWCIMFQATVDSHLPLKKIRARKKIIPWFSEEVEDYRQFRDALHEKAINNGNEDDWLLYKQARNRVTFLQRQAKANYHTNGINDAKGNCSLMWVFLNKLLPRKSSQCTYNVKDESDIICSSPTKVASIFNVFFVNIGRKLAAKIKVHVIDPISYLKKFRPNIEGNFQFVSFQESEIFNLLNQLNPNKATGVDCLKARVLKLCAPAIAGSLTRLFNKCIGTGEFPAGFKDAKVVPIFKAGDRTDTSNYRPVSVLPVLSKLLEKLLHKQLYDYFNNNKLFYSCQSGFRSGFSTQASLHYIMEHFYENLNNSKLTGIVSLDLRKAFDTVNFDILLDKLYYYGVTGNSLKLCKSYLSNRHQCVSIEGKVSDFENITLGVPQGSILGPLMFIIYINDISSSVQYSHVNIYADDTAIFLEGNDIDYIRKFLQLDMEGLSVWLEVNKLSLNLTKTVCMVVTTHQKNKALAKSNVNLNLNIVLNEEEIEQVDVFKYLGTHLDSRVNFNYHIDYMCRKISKAIGVMKYVSKYVPQQSKKLIYNTIVMPHFDYCCTVWSATSKYNIERLQKLQNRAMRIILQCRCDTHIRDMLNRLGFLSIENRIKLHLAILMFKIKNNLVPDYLMYDDLFFHNVRSHRLQYNNNFQVNRHHSNSLHVRGVQLWNSLPREIKTINNLVEFKKQYIKYVWDSCD